MKENSLKPLVSVVVTTRNEEKCLNDCLLSVKEQTYSLERIEMIVIDNNSTDQTKTIAQNFTDKVFNHGPERSAQRNLGLKKAKGKYILYLDADMILSREIINQCVAKCETEGYLGLYIPEKIVGKGFWIKVRNFERSFYNETCIDAVRFVEKEKALKIGGFDENLTGPEDWDFDRRMKKSGRIGIIKAALYHDEGKFNFRQYLAKKEYYAKSFKNYIDKWGKTDITIKKQLCFNYRFFGVFSEGGKWKKLIKHPFLTLGMYALRISLGTRYLWIKPS